MGVRRKLYKVLFTAWTFLHMLVEKEFKGNEFSSTRNTYRTEENTF